MDLGKDHVPTYVELIRLASAIGNNWEMLGISLGLSNVKIDHIKMDNDTSVKQIYQMLLAWTQKNGEDATLAVLHKAMKEVKSVSIDWEAVPDHVPTNGELISQFEAIEKNLEMLGTFFGLSNVKINQIRKDNEAPEKRILQLLFAWAQKNGEDAMKEVKDVSNDWEAVPDGKAPDSQVTPKKACLVDGRLIQLAATDIDDLKKCCTKLIGKGGFGTVYASEKSLDRFGMQIAVKKCPALDGSVRRLQHSANLDYGTYMHTFIIMQNNIQPIEQEMFASRIMNPFILPLLAAEKIGKEIWFVSPYFEGGDLLLAIENDRAPKEIKMNQLTRLKIILQIAFAIQYIHTEVETIRDVTLHKDICSKNVVLDKNYNARLIDFGLAREKNDDTSHARGAKSAYQHPGIEDNEPATESWDYYAFGVVIREMLTGFHPTGDTATKYLRKLSKEEISKHSKGSTVWSSEVAQKLNKIAADCLDVTHKEWNVENFKKEVVDKIEDICRECNILKFLDLSEDQQKRCHICIINPVAKESSMKKDHRDNCTQKIEVCIACEKNSFLNPIICYCGTELKPCIGSGWGALLVAGNHSNDSLANAMTQDVKEMKRVITSKAPRIMGISEENVRIVVPAKPGKPLSGATPETKLRQEVMSKLRDIRQDEIDTLLVYFSCEGIKDDADEHNKTFRFKLAPDDDSISLNDFTTELNNLANVNNLIVFLDCCNAPLLSDIGKKKLLQITSCKENETAKLNDKGSTFTKYIIQGLKAKSEKTCKEECHHCKQYWQTQDSFISAHSLFCYVKNHTGSKENTPKPDIKMMSEFPLAFYTAEPVEIDFTFEEEKTEKRVPLEYLGTMEQLEEKLRKEFGKDETVKVTINKKTHRKKDEKKKEECSSLDQVMSAWVQRHPLYVSFQAARG